MSVTTLPSRGLVMVADTRPAETAPRWMRSAKCDAPRYSATWRWTGSKHWSPALLKRPVATTGRNSPADKSVLVARPAAMSEAAKKSKLRVPEPKAIPALPLSSWTANTRPAAFRTFCIETTSDPRGWSSLGSDVSRSHARRNVSERVAGQCPSVTDSKRNFSDCGDSSIESNPRLDASSRNAAASIPGERASIHRRASLLLNRSSCSVVIRPSSDPRLSGDRSTGPNQSATRQEILKAG